MLWDIILAGEALPAAPVPRRVLSAEAWRAMAEALGQSPSPAFQALWADADQVYALFTMPDPVLVSAPVEAGLYQALSPARPEAALFERAVADLWGHQAANAIDARPWLDHGGWTVLRPMLARPIPNPSPPDLPEMRALPGEMAHRTEYGPIHAGPAPSRVAITAEGERTLRLELRLGYAHRGILALMRGRSPEEAVRWAARAGGMPVAHALAFCRAVEAALGLVIPPRAAALRDALLALEAEATTQAGAAREAVLQANAAAFGHRLLMDLVVPGGVARDIAPGAAGPLGPGAPEGPIRHAVPFGGGEGLGFAETPSGPVWCWVCLRSGRIAESFLRDPAWLALPAIERRAVGAWLQDLPALMAPLRPAIGGMDL